MKKMIEWKELSQKQRKAIFGFVPPKYYVWFYRFYKKILLKSIFLFIVTIFTLAIVHNTSNIDFFNTIKIIFFIIFILGLWTLSAYLTKHFFTKKYAKKIGLTIKNWNYLTKGMTFDN